MAKPQTREFVLQRDYVLASTLGHRIAFKKGIPVSIPSELEEMALGIGAVPAEGEVPVTKEVQNPAINTGPSDSKTRAEDIKAAMKLIREANQRNDFAASGVPKITALARVLGYEIDTKERDKMWQALRDEEAEEQ